MSTSALALNSLATAARPPARLLPPLLRSGGSSDDLSLAQRRVIVAGILALHVAGVWGLLQVSAVREAVLHAAPMFVDLIAQPARPTPVAPPPPQAQPLATPPPQAPVIATAPSAEPTAFVVPTPPPEPAPPAPQIPMLVVAAPAPPAPPSPPKTIPASAVQYLEPPVLVYPRMSERNGERGRVMVRVYIDTAGLPQLVQVGMSSGFVRLDEAALAAVRKARFKPYTENGQPAEGWTTVSAIFE